MPTDSELIAALCRASCGWDGESGGSDHKDFLAADQMVRDHSEKVRGSFAPAAPAPSLLEAAEAALDFIGTYSEPKHPRAVLSLKLQAAIAAQH